MLVPHLYTFDYLATHGYCHDAREMLLQVERMAETATSPFLSYQMLGRRAYSNMSLGRLKEAEALAIDAISSHSQLVQEHSGDSCWLYCLLAEIYLYRGDEVAMRRYMGLARAIADQLELPEHKAYVFCLSAENDVRNGGLEAAQRNYAEALALASECNNPSLEGWIRLGIADTFLADGNLSYASKEAHEVLSRAETMDWLRHQIRAHIVIASTLLQEGSIVRALEHIETGRKLQSRSGYFWTSERLAYLLEEALEGR